MKISIITVTKNCQDTIRDTIESVLSQRYHDLEYIIIDGGSTDNTLQIINEYLKSISVLISEKDKGISDAFNKGIKHSTGDIIGIINGDDILYKGALEEVNNCFLRYRNADVIYGKSIVYRNSIKDGYIVKPNLRLEFMRYYFTIIHPSTFIKKSAYERYGLFNTDYKVAMDYELISKMYYKGAAFVYDDFVFSGFRKGGISQENYIKTIKEHKVIALNNGANEFIIDIFLCFRRVKLFFLRILNGNRLEKMMRKLIKHQQYFSSY